MRFLLFAVLFFSFRGASFTIGSAFGFFALYFAFIMTWALFAAMWRHRRGVAKLAAYSVGIFAFTVGLPLLTIAGLIFNKPSYLIVCGIILVAIVAAEAGAKLKFSAPGLPAPDRSSDTPDHSSTETLSPSSQAALPAPSAVQRMLARHEQRLAEQPGSRRA
jgi:hypothetical protein